MTMTEQAGLKALLAYAGQGRARLAAFLRDIGDEEWEWTPEDGTPSAREAVAGLLAEEELLRGRFVASLQPPVRTGAPGRSTPPTDAAEAVKRLAAVRAATLAAVRAAPGERQEEAVRFLGALAFADGAVFGHVALLLRLMDPLRASPAFL